MLYTYDLFVSYLTVSRVKLARNNVFFKVGQMNTGA